jgi:hypothetical protein
VELDRFTAVALLMADPVHRAQLAEQIAAVFDRQDVVDLDAHRVRPWDVGVEPAAAAGADVSLPQ